jgi:hypothetical protein
MQTRTNSAVRFGWSKAAAMLAIAMAATAFAAPAVHAQVNKSDTTGAIRLGAYIPVNSNTQQTYGRYYWAGGLDYYFQQNGVDQRSNFSVDYTSYTDGNNYLRIIPVTVGQQSILPARGRGVRPYVGYGIGAYFVHVKNPSNPSFGASDTVNSTVYGGYMQAGLDLTDNLFVDARYHIVSPVKNVNTDSFELTAGVRF